MVVGDVADELFGETGLTGLVESDLASKAAVGHVGVSKSYEFFDVDGNGAS
jgi:hypothetical protein